MEVLFRGIALEDVSTSMTINAPAAMMLALYVAVAEKQGAKPAQLRGTIQADILKEYIAQKEWIYPPRPSHADHHRHDRVLRAGDAAMEPDLGQRLSHPRGGVDRRAGTGVHAGRRLRVCGGGHRAGHGRR